MVVVISSNTTLYCEPIPQLTKDDFEVFTEDGKKKTITKCIYDEERKAYTLILE